MKSINQMRRELAHKAAGDESFRSALIADPRRTISKEIDVHIPEGFTIVVHEDSATLAHLILRPNQKLSDAELEAAAGGGGEVYGMGSDQ